MSFTNLIDEFQEGIKQRAVDILIQENPSLDVALLSFKFEIPPDGKMGHLAFACFPFAKPLRKAPALIANLLADKWGASSDFQTIEAKGPYLNFFFNPDSLARTLIPLCAGSQAYGDNASGSGKRIMVEYSSPNTNKPLHLGHGRNNLLGMVLSRLLERNSYEVIKANLVNDRGIHICKSMLAYSRWGENQTPDSIGKKGDKLVGDFYVLYNEKEKENPDLIDDVQQMLRDWEAEDPETVELWKMMNGWVLEGFRKSYDRLGVSFDKFYFESETYKGGKRLVQNALKSGVCYEEENGAVAIDLEAEKLGKKILLRGDGTAMYITQDISTTVTKFNDYDLDGCLFVVGNEQDNHFRLLFKILEKFGYHWANRCEHVSYGMITLPEGKMKSREGTVVDLDDLMESMKEMALEEIKKRWTDEAETDEKAMSVTAESIGQAAIKFFILKTSAVKEISFDPKESLSFDGATGPYLQYTHARICSLLRKAGNRPDTLTANDHQWNPDETTLLVALSRFPNCLRMSAIDRNPAILCGYVYDLCRSFNKFYYGNSILKSERKQTVQARLSLTKAVKGVLLKSLTILGIDALERM